ncbi:septum formation protein Maf [bacterium]|nr:septum formation protein Maf [bacterium]
MQNIKKLFLASQSPRRKEYLNILGVQYQSISPKIDESCLINEKPLDYLYRVIHLKTDSANSLIIENSEKNSSEITKDFVTLTADTIVLVGDTIFQKPESEKEEKEFLKQLSNRWHQVITGFHIFSNYHKIDYYNFVKTDILFKKLSESEIDFYISLNEYSDKAGGYGIQGAASFMIKEIHGSYSNVVGFPIEEIFTKLQDFEIIKL